MVVTCCRIPHSNRKITPYRLPRTCQTLPRASQTTIIISVCVIKISHNYHLLLLAQHCEHQYITNKMSNIRTIHDTPTASSNRFSMSPIGGNPIYVGTLFGIEITLHPLLLLYFVISAALPWLLNASTMTMKVWLYSVVVNIPLLFTTVLVHELGHCFATRKVGGEVAGILLWPLGGLAYIGHSGDAKDDLIVSIAGPLTHIPQALLWYGLSQAFTRGTFMDMLCVQALWLNISLMLFNLFIPCYPLDGGRIFAASLQLMKVRVDIAAKICAFVSLVCACLVKTDDDRQHPMRRGFGTANQ